MKKLFSIILLACSIVSMGCAQTKGKNMEAIKGRDGLFANISTSKGDILVELFYEKTPLTVTNFVGLAEGTLDAAKGKKFYDGLKFHRVIENFMIQGGDPEGTGRGGPGYKFADEPVKELIFDKPGKLAMANAGPGTNGSQFFITHVPTDWLNYKHTIFGEVVTGQDVVNAVQQDDKIVSITIIRQGAKAEAFTATQADFDRLVPVAAKAVAAFKEAEMADVIEGCEKTSNGIYYQILREGKGSEIGKGKTVKAEYKGYLVNGQIFDASREFHPQGHEPLEFKTGAGDMIPGFDQMVCEMKINEIRKIVIPPELAYGDYGIPQAGIPGGAYICFDVKVVSVK
ncbi:MAG: peptidylprolyl isomerase [Treponema sp.]|nr:peptidylprolyl isomerase [Candidatus Treponema merdequi]